MRGSVIGGALLPGEAGNPPIGNLGDAEAEVTEIAGVATVWADVQNPAKQKFSHASSLRFSD